MMTEMPEPLILKMPTTTTNVSEVRWRKAYKIICCSRALLPKSIINVSPVPDDRVVISVVKDDTLLFDIDEPNLSKLVKEQKMDHVAELGGVTMIASALKTDLQNGIHSDAQQISRRQEVFGTNTYPKPSKKSFFSCVVQTFKQPNVVIPLACGAFSLGFGMKEDGVSIFVAVFAVISISAIRRYRQDRWFNKLFRVSSNIEVEVVRSSTRQRIAVPEIVVGDIIFLQNGDQVPADGLFLDGVHSLQIDKSTMTGETVCVEVNSTRNPFLISGTKVADGYGTMLVTSVGMNNTWGEMMTTISCDDTNEDTPLQSKLNKLTTSMFMVSFAAAFIVLLVCYFTGNGQDGKGKGKAKIGDIINVVITIITSAVVTLVSAIPGGLPLGVRFMLANLMNRKIAGQAMVRKFSACETMGYTSTICITGTLTMNKIVVTKFFLGHESMEESGSTSTAANVVALLHEAVCLHTIGNSGSPTEKAINSWAVLRLKMDIEDVKRSCTLGCVKTFNSERQTSGVLMKTNADNTFHAHWKGAAYMILAMCSHYYNHDGEVKALDENEREKFEELIRGMASSSLQCIAFAYKKIAENAESIDDQAIEDKGLVLLGLIAVEDCGSGLKKAVEDFHNAGVNVKIITSDSVLAAKAIATECGILEANQDVVEPSMIEGFMFRNFTSSQRLDLAEKISVMPTSSPSDQRQMVQCLRKRGHVVAVIGDGTNDATVLKEAHVGISMGITGTILAKESSDIEILDDDFASVVKVLKWGRCVYNNVQKFIQFQLTTAVTALVINFVAAVSGGKVPITAVRQLWVYLLMDTLGSLAFGNEQPTKELMMRPPILPTSEPLINNIMWRNLIAQASYQIFILLTMHFAGEKMFSVNEKVRDTLIFNTFVLCQVFNEFNARKLEKKNVLQGIHRNTLFLIIICVTVIIQFTLIEFLKKFADTERLNWEQWGVCIGLAAVSWPIGWLIKFVPVPRQPLSGFISIFWMHVRAGRARARRFR